MLFSFYPCKDCERIYESRYLLTQHQLSHSNTRIECDVCTKTFTNVGAMRAHMKKEHTLEERRKEQETQTQLSVDGINRRYVCGRCGKEFALDRSASYLLHIKKCV